MKHPVIIIGGGLAGLISSIELARRGIEVLVIERKSYPHHKVCGEYVSNEVRPYLESLGLDLDALDAATIREFRLTSPKGSLLSAPLKMGGFGISRYVLDYALYRLAVQAGVVFQLNTIVSNVTWQSQYHRIETSDFQVLEAQIVLGTFGKRTRLDKLLDRTFMNQDSPYVGVKYHIQGNFSRDSISLHNFKEGYCGISAIEENKFCLCYLTHRSNVKEAGSLAEMERSILGRNPHLREIFATATFLYDRPEVINEISFAPKNAVEDHLLMAGDSAGLITPLCGNGMAMAIRAGRMAAQEVEAFWKGKTSRAEMEAHYRQAWRKEFAGRLRVGRTVQRLFGKEVLTETALTFLSYTPRLLNLVIESTHGNEVACDS